MAKIQRRRIATTRTAMIDCLLISCHIDGGKKRASRSAAEELFCTKCQMYMTKVKRKESFFRANSVPGILSNFLPFVL